MSTGTRHSPPEGRDRASSPTPLSERALAPDLTTPTLTVSITGDPATPYQDGVNPARVLGGSLLTVEGAQHGIAMPCQSTCTL